MISHMSSLKCTKFIDLILIVLAVINCLPNHFLIRHLDQLSPAKGRKLPIQ